MIEYAGCSTTKPADVEATADFLLTLGRSWDGRELGRGPVRWARAPVAQGIEHLSPKEVAQVRILPGAPGLTCMFGWRPLWPRSAWDESWDRPSYSGGMARARTRRRGYLEQLPSGSV